MGRFLPLAFLLAVPSQWLLWTMGSVTTPHPLVLAVEVVGLRPAVAQPVTQLRIFNLNVLHGYPEFEGHESRVWRTAHEAVRVATSQFTPACIRQPISDHDAIVVDLRRR